MSRRTSAGTTPARAAAVLVATVAVLAAFTACGGGSTGDGRPAGSPPTGSGRPVAVTTSTRVAVTTAATSSAPPTVPPPSTTLPPPTTGPVPPEPVGPDGPYAVTTVDLPLVDPGRSTQPGRGRPERSGRVLPTRVYRPEGPGPFPLFVWSHGLDASTDYFDPFLRAWAARGYVVVSPDFPLTRSGTPGGTVYGDYVNQPADVRFVLDHVLARYGPGGTDRAGLVDADRIAVGGHSLGAVTSLALAGSPCCNDARVRAAVAVDGQRPRLAGAAGSVAVPVLLIHGDGDTTFPVAESQAMFDAATGPRHLVVLIGAPHTPFRRPAAGRVIEATVADFLDLTVGGRGGAAQRLAADASVAGVARYSS